VLAPVLEAMLLAFFMEPLVASLERRGVRRSLAIVAVGSAFAVVVAAVLLVLVPFFIGELSTAVTAFPTWANETWVRLTQFLQTRLGVNPGDLAPQLAGVAGSVQEWLVSSGTSALERIDSLLNLILIPVLAYYFSADYARLVRVPLLLVPERHHEGVVRRVTAMRDVVYDWAGGQVRVGLVLSVLYTIGLWLSGVRFAPMIGFVSGMGNMVPYVGTAIGMLISLLIVAVDGGGLSGMVAVVVTFSVVQLLEGYVITPYIIGERVGLSPLALIVVLIVGGTMFGFFGMLLAIPVAAAGTVLGREALERYQRSDFYRRQASGPEDPGSGTVS
jgi:predicted PurR-regulated permease PerM